MRVGMPESVAYPVVLFDQDCYPIVVFNGIELADAYEDGMWDEIESAFDATSVRFDADVDYLISVEFVPRGRDDEGFDERLRDAVKRRINQERFFRRAPTPQQQDAVDGMGREELLSWIGQHLWQPRSRQA